MVRTEKTRLVRYLLYLYCVSDRFRIHEKRLQISEAGRKPGGVLDHCLGTGVPPRFKILTLFRTKNTLKTLPCVGQQPPFKAGVNVKAVFTSLNTAFLPISRSRFKRRQIPMLITLSTIWQFCVNFWVIFRCFGKERFFLKG